MLFKVMESKSPSFTSDADMFLISIHPQIVASGTLGS